MIAPCNHVWSHAIRAVADPATPGTRFDNRSGGEGYVMRGLFLAMTLLAAAPAWAQVQSRPTEPPIVTAENEQWYKLGEPLQVGGDVYYPAGASVFFNGNTMVRTAHFNGVPLYADTTVEPYSQILVPVSRGVMMTAAFGPVR